MGSISTQGELVPSHNFCRYNVNLLRCKFDNTMMVRVYCVLRKFIFLSEVSASPYEEKASFVFYFDNHLVCLLRGILMLCRLRFGREFFQSSLRFLQGFFEYSRYYAFYRR